MSQKKLGWGQRLLSVLLSLLLLLTSSPAFAALQSRFEVITFKPAIDNSPYFTVYGSQTLDSWQGHAGFYFDYANRPLQFVGLGAVAGQRQSVIDHLMVGNLFGSIGVTDWAEVGLNIPIVFYNWFFTDDAAAQNDHGGGLGDIEIGAKFRIIDNETGFFGFAVRPFVTLPSGDTVRYTGNGSLTGGLDLIADFRVHRRFNVAVNMGAALRDDVTRNGVRVDDQLNYGIALNWEALRRFYVIGEAFGSTTLRDMFGLASHSPFEVGAGVRYAFGETGLAADVGGTLGVVDGVGSPRFRVIAGLRWNPPSKACPECPPPAPPPDPRIQGGKITLWGKVYFDTDKTDIKEISYPVLDDVADVMQRNPQLRLVEIQGHCDTRGGDNYNMKLSQGRAESVKDYLVGKGIDANRLQPKGYGFHEPIADNKTREGMSQNRRVEFVILERD